MAKLNEYELDTLLIYADTSIKGLGIKYDIQNPFKILKGFENGRTGQRFRLKRETELDYITRDI